MIIVLGDRYEITSAVLLQYVQNVPIVHLYGGSVTEGAIDEKIDMLLLNSLMFI